MHLIAELRRRNVIRMGGLYLVGAWLLVQVAETVLPVFDVPGWVLRAIIIMLALGFVPAVVFSWIYELTPDGLQRDSGVSAQPALAATTAKRMDGLFFAGLIVLIGLIAADRYWPVQLPAPAPAAVPVPAAEQTGEQAMPSADRPETASADPTDRHSIAVLPFLNMSADAENAFFADGISEELLNVLSRIDGLKVASRTSAFTFKGKDTPIPEIARLLGVRHVLEGSVRKQGQRVRITAQLIHADSDGHLWSQTYDRELTDIFKIQEEIAQAIAGELGDLLGTRTLNVDAPTSDLAAYESFLRGRARFHQRAQLVDALADLESAVASDPQFVDAWIYLAATNYVLPGYSDALTLGQAQVAAQAAVLRAQGLRPNDPMLLAVQGELAGNESKLVAALDLLERASALSEHDSTPVLWLGMNLMQAGYVDEAIDVLERAVRMDPLVGINNGALSFAYFYAGQFERAMVSARIGATGGWPAGLMMQMIELATRGDRAQAADLITTDLASSLFAPETPAAEREAFIAAVRDPSTVDAWVALLSEDPAQNFFLAEQLIAMGRVDQFFDWFTPERLAQNRHSWMLRTIWLPSTSALREDPRFIPIAKAYGLIDLWEQRGYPPGCRLVNSASGDHLDCSGREP